MHELGTMARMNVNDVTCRNIHAADLRFLFSFSSPIPTNPHIITRVRVTGGLLRYTVQLRRADVGRRPLFGPQAPPRGVPMAHACQSPILRAAGMQARISEELPRARPAQLRVRGL